MHIMKAYITDLLEQIPQVGHGLRFFVHGTRRPYAGVAGLNRPRVHCSAFANDIPLLFAL
jgi:hypothetical protein